MSILKLPKQEPTLRLTPRPNDANAMGDIFGGWLMSQIDIAGSIIATERTRGPVATIAVKELIFLNPIFVYDIVSFYSKITHIGTTSITIEIEVFAQRAGDLTHTTIMKVSHATLVYVAVEAPGKKRKIPTD